MPRLQRFNEATIADENYIEAYYELGDVLLVHLSDTAQATHVLQKALTLDADHARMRTLTGHRLFS